MPGPIGVGAANALRSSALAGSPFGLSDTPYTGSSANRRRAKSGKPPMESFQSNQLSRAQVELDQLYSRGIVTHDEYDEAMQRQTGDNRNILQKVLFDLPVSIAGKLGADVYDEEGNLENYGRQATGGALDTIADVLSLPLYAVASISEGAVQGIKGDRGLNFGLFKAGFSPSAFAKAWHSRADYMTFSEEHSLFGDGLWSNLGGGLAMDIALDPLTYVTWGVSAGARVAKTGKLAAAAAKATGGAKIAAHAGKELSLTRQGTRIFRLAGEELVRHDEAMMGADGLVKNLWDGAGAASYQQRIAEHAVANFDRFSMEATRRLSQGKWRKLSHLFPASEANRSMLTRAVNKGVGQVDDMFQETASALARERGVYDIRKAQHWASGGMAPGKAFGREVPGLNMVNDAARWTFNKFDSGWNADRRVVEQARLAGIVIKGEMDASLKRFGFAYRGMDKATREIVSRAVEEAELFEQTGQGFMGIATKYGDDVAEAVRFTRAEMDNMLNIERAAGYGTESFHGYMSHIHTDPRQLTMAMKSAMSNGEKSIHAASGFTQQRLIATYAMGEEILGEGKLIEDAYDVMRIRKKASLDLIHRTNFNKWIVDNMGIPEMLIQSATHGMDGSLLRGFFRRAGYGVQEVIQIDQVYKSVNGNLTRLGFKDGDLAYNAELMKYLMREAGDKISATTGRAGKDTAEGLAHAEALGVNDAARMHMWDSGTSVASVEGSKATVDLVHARSLPDSFSFSRAGRKYRGASEAAVARGVDKGLVEQGTKIAEAGETIPFKIDDAMKMMQDPAHPGWDAVVGISKTGKPDIGYILSWLKGFNKYTTKYLDSQIAGFIPDVEERIVSAIATQIRNNGSRLDPKKVEQIEVAVARTIAEMSNPLELRRIVPQVSVSVDTLAKATREAAGIITDTSAMHPWTINEVHKNAVALGFDSGTLGQLVKNMFGEDAVPRTLNQAEADVLLDMFYQLVDDTAVARTMGVKGGRFEGARKLGHLGGRRSVDKTVKRTFTFSRKVEGNVLPEAFDQSLGIPMAEGSIPGTSPAGQELAGSADEIMEVGDEGSMLMHEFDTGRQAAATGVKPEQAALVKRIEASGNVTSLIDSQIEAATRMRPSNYREINQVKDQSTLIRRFRELEADIRHLGTYRHLPGMDESRVAMFGEESAEQVARQGGLPTDVPIPLDPMLAKRAEEGVDILRTPGPKGRQTPIGKAADKASKAAKTGGVVKFEELKAEFAELVPRIAEILDNPTITALVKGLDQVVNETNLIQFTRSSGYKLLSKEAARKLAALNIRWNSTPAGVAGGVSSKVTMKTQYKALDKINEKIASLMSKKHAELSNRANLLKEFEASRVSSTPNIGGGALVGEGKLANEATTAGELASARRGAAKAAESFTPSTELSNAYKARSELTRALGDLQQQRYFKQQELLAGQSLPPEAAMSKMQADLTAADKLVKELEQVEMPADLLRNRLRGSAAFKRHMEGVVQGSPYERALSGAIDVPSPFAGGLRPDPSKFSIDVYLPESVATVIDDFMSPAIDPAMSEWAKKTLQTYDRIQSFYKSNLLLPWSGTWMRNAISNTAIVFMKQGFTMLSPADNFRNMRDYYKVMGYVMGSATDLPTLLAPGKSAKVKAALAEWGEHLITSPQTGREIKVKDLAELMYQRGVYKGMTTAEGLDVMAHGQRLGGSISGGAAGAMVGAIGGGLAGAVAGAEDKTGALAGAGLGALAGAGLGVGAGAGIRGAAIGGGLGGALGAGLGGAVSQQGEGQEVLWGASYASLMGLAMGAVLGGRKMGSTASRAKWAGGLPVPTMDGVTGVLQSQWAPFMRVGEAATETPFRVALFMQEFKETGSAYKASNTVYQHLNDWNALSTFERRIMRRMVPFYTWSKLAFRQSFTTMVEEPGRLNNIVKTFKDWNQAHGADPEDIPDFYHDRLVALSRADAPFLRDFMDPEKGDAILSGLGFPIEDVTHMLSGLPGGKGFEIEAKEARQAFLTRGPFVVTSALEHAFNTESFTGREIKSDSEVSYYADGDRWEGAPGWLKLLVGYKPSTPDSKAVVNPQMAWILGEVPVSRFIDATKKIHSLDDEQRAEVNLYSMARLILGPGIYRVDPETNRYFYNKARVEALTSVLASVGAIRKRDDFSDVNPDDLDYQSRRSRGGRRRGSRRGR